MPLSELHICTTCGAQYLESIRDGVGILPGLRDIDAGQSLNEYVCLGELVGCEGAGNLEEK